MGVLRIEVTQAQVDEIRRRTGQDPSSFTKAVSEVMRIPLDKLDSNSFFLDIVDAAVSDISTDPLEKL